MSSASERRTGRKGATEGISDAAQDYLREIYKLQQENTRVTTSALARRMNVSAPSATAMVKKLAALELADHTPYRGVRLTPAGERIALEVTRHHRLIELYLAETLDLGIDAVHEEADRLEHALSEELELRLDELLGRPTHDPHGDPIPNARLKIEQSETRQLTALAPGDEAIVRKIPDGDAELLRYLARLALVPGQSVTLIDAAPCNGPLTLRVNGRKTAISFELAEKIRVAA
jgi:DtxR family Mn-dependent transcriptional regulator